MNKQCTQHFRDEWLKEAIYRNWLQKVESDEDKPPCNRDAIRLPMMLNQYNA